MKIVISNNVIITVNGVSFSLPYISVVQ